MALIQTSALIDSLCQITLIAVIVSSASGVLIACFKQFDLFDVIIIAIAKGPGGGSLRDILSNEPPLVFHSSLQATVSWLASLLFIGLLHIAVDVTLAAAVAGLSIFISRLIAVYFNINLPALRFKS